MNRAVNFGTKRMFSNPPDAFPHVQAVGDVPSVTNKWVPMPVSSKNLAGSVGREYYQVVTLLRQLGVVNFTLPAGHPGLKVLVHQLLYWARARSSEYRAEKDGGLATK